MKRIQLWLIEKGPKATRVEELSDTDTERQLEELLVASSDILLEGLEVVGRQIQTGGGPLDLLGIDPEGRLVIFELKRGVLTRDAVAQIIDYASDFAQRSPQDVARLIEEHSGHDGVQKIEDFLDWYGREYPDSEDVLRKIPRMVLVGLGADERAMRMVNFLASSGIDIQLLTFHAFRSDGKLLLARQTESQAPSVKTPSTGSKDKNLQTLLETAEQIGSRDLLLDVANYLSSQIPSLYRWPGKTAFSFVLQERTSDGKPTARSYFALWVDKKAPRGAVVLTIPERVVETVGSSIEQFMHAIPEARKSSSSWMTFQLTIGRDRWPNIRPALGDLVASIRREWEQASRAAQIEEQAAIKQDLQAT